MPSTKTIWVLLGDRQGNNNQSLGVAEALGWNFETKLFEFHSLISRLPNGMVARTTLGISPLSLPLLSPPWPDIVIAAGRKLARIALYIKSKNPACFLVQIQWPGYPSRPFDLIAPPLHDKARNAANVVMTIGAPHRVTQALLASEANSWRSALSALPAPKIALLLGGTAHNRSITDSQIIALGQLSSRLASMSGGSLLITTSRRTAPQTLLVLKQHLTCPYYLHEWKEGEVANPYYGFLGLADALIATGDSVTMCSEACSTGKPVFIYSADNFTSSKHRSFHQALYKRELAKPLQENSAFFTPPFQLDDAGVIADAIRQRNI